MKKLVTMQDISGVGKCSLTVAIPTLSVMGIEVVPFVTAVLSSHTAFQNVHGIDLTEDLDGILDAWGKEGFQFDGVYTAYLGSMQQVRIAKRLLQTFGNQKMKIVDPCMGDHGKLYRGFHTEFVNEMRELCKMADILTPNLTEACYLLNHPMAESFSKKELQQICMDLCSLGCKMVILTGASLEDGRVGALAYDSNLNQFSYYDTERLPQDFHGTGDLFTSVLAGALLNGLSAANSMQLACDFVHDCIRTSMLSSDSSYGIHFEKELRNLMDSLSSALENQYNNSYEY